jgi:hypothetical protein
VSTISLELGVSSFLAREAIFPVSFSSRNFYLKATATYFSFTHKKEYKLLSDYHFYSSLTQTQKLPFGNSPYRRGRPIRKKKIFRFPWDDSPLFVWQLSSEHFYLVLRWQRGMKGADCLPF